MVLENVISTKTLLSTQVKYYKFQYEIQNTNIIFFQLEETAANFSYKIQNHRRYLNVSRNIIT